ncbi:MATE family efflux transporter [Desulfopila aestuarii]|uniref:Uncharacterized protein n=1 Tax=Desulfopila aestuarii DSM 18488 TaxID=1121416 RepID=A0A1M7XWC0_9BACT|nr:hypothetical protein [Desulfopila aestuarii]SHO42838.1 hypothetical protein SAMN02745220_00182 [Desulfopila aestuarii DSM 18488]
MKHTSTSIFFDKNDYELLRIVNDVIGREAESQSLHSLLNEHMHPQGIKEMAAARGLRIAYAIASLLGSFEKGTPSDRIRALRSLRDEVLLSSSSFYQKNTARVLLQIMKELLRSRGNELRQLKLAHDFRMVSTGNPRKVRTELARFHLLEMPEEWNQFAFDDHVHDANTKGRKSPTHLLMDAWIKGIRYLTVIYYNYVRPDVVRELIEASAILDIRVQVGIEISSRFRDKYVRFTWEPHGFSNNDSFLKFLEEDSTIELMRDGRQVSKYQQQYVFDVLDTYNEQHRLALSARAGVTLPPLDLNEFLSFVGVGQPSLLHLARFIHDTLQTTTAPPTENAPVDANRRVERPSVESIINDYLLPSKNPQLHDPTRPQDCDDLPPLLSVAPEKLLSRLLSLHSSSRFTLNLSNLSVQDTLELLFNCAGMISHVETYNLTNAAHGTAFISGGPGTAGDAVDLKSPEKSYHLINDLQKALNDDNVIVLKRVIRAIIWDHDEQYLRLKKQLEFLPEDKTETTHIRQELIEMVERKEDLMNILYNLETFHTYYQKRTLRSRIGSGSTGQAAYRHGMGLVVLDTLPMRARRTVREEMKKGGRECIPVSALLTKNAHKRLGGTAEGLLERLGFSPKGGKEQWFDWSIDGFLVHPGAPGNIATLGGVSKAAETDSLMYEQQEAESIGNRWKYLNTNLKNSLKVLFGLIPAFFTFALTKDWWLLAYFGAFIWFGITGSRNIIQSVLGGGGLKRSPLLPWNSLVSWSRIADSLLYTGFSVPLLDFLVKTLLLDRGFGINTATDPITLYAVMGLANGIYISSHNTLRGLPKGAAIGNFFRSILAIPIAILLNSLVAAILAMAGIPDVSGILQKWAAIISKFASDCVAAVIEGLADRQTNIKARLTGYRSKISQLFYVFSKLDMQFPEEDVLEMLASPKMMMQTLDYEARDQEKLIIVNALDLMYFWMYQPRARKALVMLVEEMSQEEWLIFYRSQLVLNRQKEISQVFVDGLVGRNFAKPLAFYLDRAEEYLADMEKLGDKQQWHARA